MISKNIILGILVVINIVLIVLLVNSNLRHKIALKIFPEKYSLHNQNSYKRRISIIKNTPVKDYQSILAGHSQVREFPLEAYFEERILNMGVGGETIEGLNNWLPEKIKEQKANKLFIQIGINDILNNEKTNALIEKYEQLILNCKYHKESDDIFIFSIFPVNRKETKINNKIVNFNSKLKFLAKENKVNYVPLYNDFVENISLKVKYDSGDGLHLNTNAYQKWSSIIKDLIKTN